MAGQLIWLFVSWGVWGAVLAVLLESGSLAWAAAVGLIVPVVRLVRRFGPGRGYYLIGKAGAVAPIDHPSRRITREHHPQFFTVWVAVELFVIGFMVVGLVARL